MSFRERVSQPPEWDADEDAPPPVWPGGADDRPFGAQNVESADLPAWSFDLTGDDERAEESVPPLPPRTRRATSSGADRRGAGWPNLRDSLRGSASGSSIGSRSARRPLSSPPTTNGRAGVADYPPGDRLDDDQTWSQFGDVAEPVVGDFGYEEPRYPIRRAPAARTRPRSRRATPARPRRQLQVPAAVAAIAAAQDRVILGAVGASLFSLLMMTATITSRSDALPDWIVTHLDAAGNPDQWGTTSTVWRLPLMTAMLTLGSLIGALFVGRRDAFAARFLAGSALLIHLLAWIGLVRILW
jgi:hypothetical protein